MCIFFCIFAPNCVTMAENYNDDNIIHLDDREHIRRRPGMYIGKLGDGSHSDDGIYVLIKETIDNSIDEFRMGEGKVNLSSFDINYKGDAPAANATPAAAHTRAITASLNIAP